MYNAPAKITKKKLIEIIILILIIIWVLMFMVNYFRYTRDEPPILAIHTKHICDDGFVHSYSTLGYTYRKYDSTSTRYTEFVPFWIGVKKCQLTNGLPVTYKDFSIPNNPKFEPNYRGLVYFYTNRTNLIGAYKCINTEDSCTLATSGVDEFDIDNKDILLARKKPVNMAVLHSKYAFVNDSLDNEKDKKNDQSIKTIYYYDILNKVILDRYSDIKLSTFDRYSYGIGDKNNYYIVRNYDNRKWGLVNFKEDGTRETILDFVYDSINYNSSTGFYILCKDGKWSVYDLAKKEYLIKDSEEVIYDFWENYNMSYYYKTGYKAKLETGEEYYAFEIHKLDGSYLLDVPNVSSIIHSKYYIMYWKYDDNTIHFMDYVLNDREEPVKLFFRELDTENNHFHPALEYELEDNGEGGVITVYEGRELKYGHTMFHFNAKRWK